MKDPKALYIITDVLDYNHIELANQSLRKLTIATCYYDEENKDMALNNIVKAIDDYKADGWIETSDLIHDQQYKINDNAIEFYYLKRFEIPLI